MSDDFMGPPPPPDGGDDGYDDYYGGDEYFGGDEDYNYNYDQEIYYEFGLPENDLGFGTTDNSGNNSNLTDSVNLGFTQPEAANLVTTPLVVDPPIVGTPVVDFPDFTSEMQQNQNASWSTNPAVESTPATLPNPVYDPNFPEEGTGPEYVDPAPAQTMNNEASGGTTLDPNISLSEEQNNLAYTERSDLPAPATANPTQIVLETHRADGTIVQTTAGGERIFTNAEGNEIARTDSNGVTISATEEGQYVLDNDRQAGIDQRNAGIELEQEHRAEAAAAAQAAAENARWNSLGLAPSLVEYYRDRGISFEAVANGTQNGNDHRMTQAGNAYQAEQQFLREAAITSQLNATSTMPYSNLGSSGEFDVSGSASEAAPPSPVGTFVQDVSNVISDAVHYAPITPARQLDLAIAVGDRLIQTGSNLANAAGEVGSYYWNNSPATVLSQAGDLYQGAVDTTSSIMDRAPAAISNAAGNIASNPLSVIPIGLSVLADPFVNIYTGTSQLGDGPQNLSETAGSVFRVAGGLAEVVPIGAVARGVEHAVDGVSNFGNRVDNLVRTPNSTPLDLELPDGPNVSDLNVPAYGTRYDETLEASGLVRTGTIPATSGTPNAGSTINTYADGRVEIVRPDGSVVSSSPDSVSTNWTADEVPSFHPDGAAPVQMQPTISQQQQAGPQVSQAQRDLQQRQYEEFRNRNAANLNNNSELQPTASQQQQAQHLGDSNEFDFTIDQNADPTDLDFRPNSSSTPDVSTNRPGEFSLVDDVPTARLSSGHTFETSDGDLIVVDRMLGEGSTRRAYLTGDGEVIKVPIDESGRVANLQDAALVERYENVGIETVPIRSVSSDGSMLITQNVDPQIRQYGADNLLQNQGLTMDQRDAVADLFNRASENNLSPDLNPQNLFYNPDSGRMVLIENSPQASNYYRDAENVLERYGMSDTHVFHNGRIMTRDRARGGGG